MFKFNVQQLKNREDIDALIEGDIVHIKDDLAAHYGENYHLSAYAGKNEKGQHMFLVPQTHPDDDYLLAFRVHPRFLNFEDGKITIREDYYTSQAITRHFYYNKHDYNHKNFEELNTILYCSGLRTSDGDLQISRRFTHGPFEIESDNKYNFLDN